MQINDLGRDLFKIIFGFFIGWIFAVYVVARIDPLGSAADWRMLAIDCNKTAIQQRAVMAQIIPQVEDKKE